MQRYLSDLIRKDLTKKAVLVSGPRQVGKTTLAQQVFAPSDTTYLNYDVVEDRRVIVTQLWSRETKYLILDEIHKFKKWKNLLKGVIDSNQTRGSERIKLLVTGSAKLEIFRKAGDALTGRTFYYRLHPIDVAEGCALLPTLSSSEVLARLLQTGGFPESFFSPEDSRRLLKDRLDYVLKEDLKDLSNIGSLKGMELLVELLRSRIGGPLNYSNLANDLSVSPVTVKNWVGILEKLYLIFLVTPFNQRLSRSIKKEAKLFFYDCSAAPLASLGGARLENLVACALLKYCHLQEDAHGRAVKLHYYRDIEKREVDFILTEDSTVLACIEVKVGDDKPSTPLKYLTERLKPKHSYQLVQDLARELDYTLHEQVIKVRKADRWLQSIGQMLR